MKRLLFILPIFLIGCRLKSSFISVNERKLEHVLVERDAYRDTIYELLIHRYGYTPQSAVDWVDKCNIKLYETHERGKLWIKNPDKDYNLSNDEKLRTLRVHLDKLLLEMYN